MSIQEISMSSNYFFQTNREESQTLWSANFKQGRNSEVRVSPETTARINPYGMKFNTFFGQSSLVLDFSVPEELKEDILLSMNGVADSSDAQICSFKLSVNGEHITNFHTVDKYVGSKWLHHTHVSIPSHFFHRGENRLEITIMGRPGQHECNAYGAYILQDISMTLSG